MKTGGIAFLRFSPALTPGIDDPGRSPLGEAYRPPHLCHCGFPKMTKRRENPSTLWFLPALCRPERSRGVSGSNQVSGNREIPRLRWERQGKQPPQSGNPLSDRLCNPPKPPLCKGRWQKSMIFDGGIVKPQKRGKNLFPPVFARRNAPWQSPRKREKS